MSWVSSRLVARWVVIVVAVAAGGCDEDEGENVGAPCRSDEDCSGALECDFHDGPIGTCQAMHTHTTGGSGEGSSSG